MCLELRKPNRNPDLFNGQLAHSAQL